MFGNAKHPKAILALCVITPVVVLVSAAALNVPQAIAPGSSQDPSAQIQQDYISHLNNIHTMNISSIQQAYTSDATLWFNGSSEGPRTISGANGIASFFSTYMAQTFTLPRFSKMNATISVTGGTAKLASGLVVNGYDIDANQQGAYVDLTINYVRDGGNWLISYESWNFTAVVT